MDAELCKFTTTSATLNNISFVDPQGLATGMGPKNHYIALREQGLEKEEQVCTIRGKENITDTFPSLSTTARVKRDFHYSYMSMADSPDGQGRQTQR